MTTKFKRNDAGAYVSLCGNARITPLYMGRTTVTAWRVEVKAADGTWERRGSHDTLAAAKSSADRFLSYVA
jgi:hypothetical protein